MVEEMLYSDILTLRYLQYLIIQLRRSDNALCAVTTIVKSKHSITYLLLFLELLILSSLSLTQLD